MFWVDTLSFRMEGSFFKGEIVELKDYVIEDKKVTVIVEPVDEEKLDKEVTDVVIPVSMVGIDKDVSLEPQSEIVVFLEDVKGENKIFLILLKVPYNRKKKVKIPLGETGNIIEYQIAQ